MSKNHAAEGLNSYWDYVASKEERKLKREQEPATNDVVEPPVDLVIPQVKEQEGIIVEESDASTTIIRQIFGE